MECRVFQMGGITCPIDAGPCHWRGFFEDSRRIRTGSLMNFLNCMQKNAWKGRAGRQKPEEAGKQELKRIERWELEGG